MSNIDSLGSLLLLNKSIIAPVNSWFRREIDTEIFGETVHRAKNVRRKDSHAGK